MGDDFFDLEDLEPEDDGLELEIVHRHPDWHGPPQGTLPGVVPLELVVARTERVAVCVTGLAAYPSGFEFQLRTLAAPEAGDVDPHLFDAPMRYRRRASGATAEIPPEFLRFGIQFPDGAKVTNLATDFPDDPPDGPVLVERGGGGSGTEWRQDMWVWPLPEAGELDFVCEWPAAGIALTRRPLETAPLRQAASRAQVVFPWDHIPLWGDADEDV